MEKIEIYIQIDTGTEGITVIPEKRFTGKEMAIYIDGAGEVNLVDQEQVLAIIDTFGVNSKSDMMGSSDYIVVYDAMKEIHTADATLIMGECLIMKNYYGLKCMNEDEIEQAIMEFRCRLSAVQVGPFCVSCYVIG